MISGVYMILNMENGKYYVGSSIDIGYRFYEHRRTLNLNIHHSILLQRAWAKFRTTDFWLLVLEIVPSSEDLICREQYYLDLLQATNPQYGYNIRPTADSSLGYRHTLETREKLSVTHRGKKQNPETVAKRVATNTGRRQTPIATARITASNRAKAQDPEFRARLSIACQLRSQDPEYRAKLSAWQTGRKRGPLSIEHRTKISVALQGTQCSRGRVHSLETRAKMSRSRLSYIENQKQLQQEATA